jgi:nucleotide-binding universal stress UspA family protein
VDPLIAEAMLVRMGSAPFMDKVRGDLDAFVQEALGGLKAGRLPVTLLAPTGSAAKELLEAAKTANASAIVVGTEGLGRARRLLFGSTTLRVMRGTDRAVLAIPPAREGAAKAVPGAITRILCGVDFSEPSNAAAATAVALGRQLDVPVTLVHAVARLTLPSVWDVMLAPTDDEREALAKTTLTKLAATLGAPAPAVLAATGEADEVFAAEAAAGDGTLVVLGLGDLSGHRPGSTAMRIMAETRVPVLAVPRTST